VGLACWLGVVAAQPADKFPAGPPKNLKILPKTISQADLKNVMTSFEKALGVECAFCHDTNDFAKDDKKHKRISREMMKATQAFNAQLFKGKPEVTCMTCHRGKEEPEVH
jgi:hypothetical protein